MIPVEAVEIVYVNWRGEQSVRSIVPMHVHFGTSPWHPEPQWLLHAQDLDKNDVRDFAVKDIKSWRPVA